MASVSDEEVAVPEETGRRSTRSKRGKTPQPVAPTPTRSSRRNKKQVEPEEVVEKSVAEEVAADSDEPDTKQVMEQLQDLIVPVLDGQNKASDENSSTNLFEEFQVDTKSSSDKDDPAVPPEESVFIANLAAEENANSLPSVVDENSASRLAVSSSVDDDVVLNAPEVVPAEPESALVDLNGDITDEVTGSSDNALAGNVAEDSKNIDLDAEAILEDELPQPVKEQVHDAVEVSDDKGMAGPDRAELPPEPEVVSKDELPKPVLELPTGTDNVSPAPEKAELPEDADNVSDDELPAVKKAELPEDADNVSDEELPAPKKAEIPEDADNVSDEELPAPKKAEIPEDADNVSDEELPAPKKAELPEDADNVSDEELPAPKKAELPEDADNVSDEELPVPANAEVPEEAQNVSDSELSAVKKADVPAETEKKRKASDAGDEGSSKKKSSGEKSSKGDGKEKKESSKRKLEKDEEKTDKTGEAPEKKTKVDAPVEPEKKKLPDLDKYWKAVNDDSTDFTAWTYLLQYVDQENDIEAAREAYDAFLAHYPYCYGYWRKYADYEKRKGSKRKCEEVFERGLKAIPLSVDLWIHYLAHVRANNTDDETLIRSQFERALAACGLEFRSDKLWEANIKWESEGKRIDRVVALYDRLLSTPTQGYANHFDHFKEVANNNPVHSLVSTEEFLELRAYVRESARKRKEEKDKKRAGSQDKVKEKEKEKDKQDDNKSSKTSKDKSDKRDKSQEPDSKESKEEKDKPEAMETDEPPKVTTGEDVNEEKENKEPPAEEEKTEEKMEAEPEEEKEADDHVNSPEEADAIKDKIISRRKKLHKATVAAVTARWTYEEGIKRPYFHVKPLERCQLKNWKEYLDFEIEQGDEKRILVLFERCLIACALYDDFWLKLIRYLDSRAEEPEVVPRIRDAYERACTIHHPDKPSLHLMWSAFEESQNNVNKAADILANLEKVSPNLMQVAYRRINLERRRGDLDKCGQLYQTYLTTAKSKTIAGNVVIKYARFLNKIKKDHEQAHLVLKNYLEKDPCNTRVALQLIDLSLQREIVDEKEVLEIMDHFMGRDGLEPDQKVLFAQRKVEFLEDFGSTAKGLQEAQKALQTIMTKANEAKKKKEQTPPKKTSKESSSSSVAVSAATSANYASGGGGSYGYSASSAPSYYGAASSQYQYGDSSSYGYSTWNQQYSQSGYGSYGQWSGYGSYY
ncbi:LOW QUALITY PROTEIN: pre-mRNA-processing factor 39 [Armigeres subalbatus]|uniref:LOW QUALITY PROTEIN: pre-mRNA-processing factor 39 n=1 Tax=Armigeres subalbatus TaxID=124917 RepID=UPI002ED18452